MEDQDIAALLESLCERPLVDDQAEPSAELLALCRKAATVLLRRGDAKAADEASDIADTDRVTAALAVLLSRDDAEEARRIVETAAATSASARLDVQSAIGFVEGVERSSQSAPAHLVDELLASDPPGLAHTAVQAASSGNATVWSRIVGSSWSARRWRLAATCTVCLVAGVASWSVIRQQADHVAREGVALPAAKAAREAPDVAVRPAPPVPAVAAAPVAPVPARAMGTSQPCKPQDALTEVRKAETRSAVAPKAVPPAAIDCANPSGHELADRPAGEPEAVAARARLEAEREAAAERAAAEAAEKVDTARARGGRGPVAADRFGPQNGMPGQDVPAAASARPATPPSLGVAPAAAPAVRPGSVGR